MNTLNHYNHDFPENTSDQEEFSRDERKFMEIIIWSVQHQEKHNKIKLSFETTGVALPDAIQSEYKAFLEDVNSQ